MTSRLLIALMLSGHLLAGAADAADSFRFEMAGARDGAMPPFSISVGLPSASTNWDIKVAVDVYAGVAAAVERYGMQAQQEEAPSFKVTQFNNASARRTLFIPDPDVGKIMRSIIVLYQAKREPVPNGIMGITNSLP